MIEERRHKNKNIKSCNQHTNIVNVYSGYAEKQIKEKIINIHPNP